MNGVKKMEYVTLNNGVKMPILGFGVYQIPPEETEQAVLNAIDNGYRLIDTAQAYRNEEGVGRAVKKSNVPREELFITTKVWISFAGYEQTMKAFEESLRRLDMDYVDLLLIHQPFGDVYGTWRAMEELLEAGKIRAIGVSNFKPGRVYDLGEFNKIKPQVNQIDVNPFTHRVSEVEQHEEYEVQTEAWAPFAEGKNDVFNNEILKSIGQKYNKSTAQVILRWLVQRKIVVIPKSSTVERMRENIDVFNFELSEEDMEQIKAIDTGKSLFYDHYDYEVSKRFVELGQLTE